MKAFRVKEFGKPVVEEILPDPVPTGKQVVVRVHSCGLCHSDVHFQEGYINLGGGGRLPLEAAGAHLPLTMGHEIYGYISDFGPQSGLQEADRNRPVIVYPWIGCGECDACQAGYDNACTRPQNLGLQRPGGYADKVVVRDAKFLIDATGIDATIGGVYACSGLTSYSALRKVPTRQGWVGIIGMGGVGLMGLSIAKGIGFEKVAAIDINNSRLELAQNEFGADLVANSQSPDAATVVLDQTGGLQAIVDFVGSDQTCALAMGLLAPGGTYVNVGLFGGQLRLPLAVLSLKQLTIRGSYVGSLAELHELIEHVRAGNIKPIPVTSRPFSTLNEGLAALQSGLVQGRQVLVV
ncbi:D-arabinose 1-dehydrogenase-like Zn-dependent alcohol dehydrogenase [Rhizobium sp. BK313]|uniref:zinc-binding dehydrogenase n=1 Tax=Rhizobium sp. BK313 TaxID=2587081 RepID=UPI0010DDBF5F|nr:zinc-binding dehydrogenase [Rhizobium sp. BK313]MBB3458288.1 D-arabinose 1-dehydrogenase-like Zn-dependent alcohol dehydrogenase [Rhizobium sp. BK313]